ncbi:hypothetical protein SAURM35S_00411 [Streptomyces aurantiogriseus]
MCAGSRARTALGRRPVSPASRWSLVGLSLVSGRVLTAESLRVSTSDACRTAAPRPTAWVRGWLTRAARRRGGTLHLLLLDVTPDTALEGQRERGRGVSRYAFLRHRRAASRLLRAVEKGRLPAGCDSAILLDRPAANALRRIAFTG